MYTLQKFSQKSDGMGGMIEAWEDYATVEGYLDLSTGSNQNSISQNAVIEESTHILLTPYRDDLHDRMRLITNNRVYKITYVDNPVGINHHLEIYLKFEGDAVGV